MNYREAWANGEIEAGTLVDAIEELTAELAGIKANRDALMLVHRVGRSLDQQRTETAADNCEVLRARLAKYEDAEGRAVGLTHDQAELVRLVRDLALRAGKHARPLIHAAALGLESQAREVERLQLTCNDIDDQNDRIYAELAALKAQPDPWKASGADWCSSIHSNPDAMAWADFFVAVFPGQADKHELMFGWFANAMMAMHDHLKAQPSGVVLPLMAALESVVHDERVPNEVSQEVAAVLIEARRLNSSPVSAGVVDERAAFEAWYETTYGISLEPEFRANHFIGYVNDKANHRWTAWQARAALSAPSHGEQVRQMVPEGVTVERDVFGTIHIKSGDFDFIQIRYQYPYTDNSGTWKLAERIVALLASPSAGSQGGDV